MAAIDSLVAYLVDLSDNFALRRLSPVMVILAFVIGALFFYEWYTARFRLARIEHELALLERFTMLGQRLSLSDQQKLKEIYAELESQLSGLSASSVYTLPVNPRIRQTLLAVFSWFGLMLLLYVFVTQRGDLRRAMGGVVLVAILGVLVAAILLPFKMRWIDYLYSVGHVILICVVLVVWQKRKVAQSQVNK